MWWHQILEYKIEYLRILKAGSGAVAKNGIQHLRRFIVVPKSAALHTYNSPNGSSLKEDQHCFLKLNQVKETNKQNQVNVSGKQTNSECITCRYNYPAEVL